MLTLNKISKLFFFTSIIIFCVVFLFFDFYGGAEPVALYTLRELNGRVAVYHNSADTPEQVLDIYTDSLHEQDRQLLREGIRLETPEQLQRIIEDFDG